jgi:DNA mismatch repair ATPase MutS
VATHDLRLSTLENEFHGRFINYSFESYLSDNELVFDYLLKRGVAGSRNATWLMKKMGLID